MIEEANNALLPWIAQALQLPVSIALFVAAAVTVTFLGGFIREAWTRSRYMPEYRSWINQLKRGAVANLAVDCARARFGFPARVLREIAQSPDATGKILDDTQLAAERLLSNLQFGVRLGPMLGLAGTLIPLGSALRALGSSDFSGLAQQMIVSFSSTVVGLFIGALCFTMHAFRQRWYTQDLNDLEFVVGRLASQNPKSTEESIHEKYPPAWQPTSER